MTDLERAVQDVARYLPAWLQRQRDLTRVPGVQVALRLDGRLVLTQAFGVADAETEQPLRTDHLFRVASHSKWFTATMVMRLVEQGLLRLDDTLGDRVSAYADTALAEVTLRSLLSHRAGVIRDGVDTDFWHLAGTFPDGARLLGLVRDHGKVFEPHEFFKYTNVGFSLVGQILEAATDTAYRDLMLHEVCRPLGLDHTLPEYDPQRAAEFASGHGRARVPGTERDVLEATVTGAMAPATGFCSTAEDLTAFASMHVLGGRDTMVSDRARRQMQHPESSITRGGVTGYYGLGTQIADVGGRRVVGHSGGFPGYITRTWVDPTDRLALSVLTNAIDGPADALATGVLTLVQMATAEPRDWQSVQEASVLEPFTGRYENLGGPLDIVRFGGRLVTLDPDTADPSGRAEELELVGDRAQVERRDSYLTSGEPLVFERDDAGAVTGVRVTGGLNRRAEVGW